MTMRAIRGFDHETAAADLVTNGVTFINNGGTIGFVTGRTTGSKAIQFGAGYKYGNLAIPLNATVASGTEVFIGGAASNILVSGSGATYFCIGVESPEGLLHAYVYFNGSSIIAYRAAANETYFFQGSPTNLGSVSYAFPTSGWMRLEVGIKVHATLGEIHVRVGGSSSDILTLTGVNTLGDTNSGMSGIAFACAGSPSNTLVSSNYGAIWDDMYCCDSAGTINNGFMGEGNVVTLFATSDVSDGFTRLSGSTNYAMVSETAMDSDTTYNYAASSGLTDVLNHGTVASTYTVHAAQTSRASKKDVAGTCSLQSVVTSSGTASTGASSLEATSYYYYTDMFETDPATGVAWTPSGLNAATFGYTRVA